MKKITFFFIFCFQLGFSQNVDSLFVQANKLYQTAQYDKAIEVYKKIENNGLSSDVLYFNMANSYYKLNKIAPAIYNYEKALIRNPNNVEAKSNLTFANRMKIDAIPELPKTFLQKLSKNTYLKWSYKKWAILAVVASFLTAIFFLLYYFSFNSKKKLLYFNSTILAVLVLLASVLFSYKNYQTISHKKEAIIFSVKTPIKNAPTNSGETIFELHEGTKVKLIETVDYWVKIKLADGKTGWIAKDAVKEI